MGRKVDQCKGGRGRRVALQLHDYLTGDGAGKQG